MDEALRRTHISYVWYEILLQIELPRRDCALTGLSFSPVPYVRLRDFFFPLLTDFDKLVDAKRILY